MFCLNVSCFCLFFLFHGFFASHLPYSLNITINCNNENKNESSVVSQQLVDEKTKEDVSDSGSFWLMLYTYKRAIFLIMVSLYFSQFININSLKNSLLWMKNKILSFWSPSKMSSLSKKKHSLCLLCQKKHSFLMINLSE